MAVYTTTSGLNGGAYLALTVTEVSQNTGGVTSTDSWSLTLYGGTRTSFDLTNTATWSVTINGTTTSGTFNYDFRPGPGTPAFCGSGTTSAISHNADGTKSISVSGSIGALPSGTTGGPATAAGTFTQTPIGVTSGAIVSRLSHTLTQPREDLILAGTESAMLTAVATLAPEITLAALPSSLSTAEIGTPSGGSTLDAFNEILDGEQGTIYSTVTGTLLSPVESLTVRERTRPSTVTASWDIEREVQDAPEFVRDVTNLVSSVTVSGPTQSAVVIDQTLNARVGSANASESILNVNSVDLVGWGQDRLQRGANTQLRLASVTIDAMTTPTDRSADLLALKPGDRHQFTNLPSTQLGFSTWDGWLLGVDETHTLTEHTFTLYFQPALSDTGIFDTSVYAADGELSLSAAINSSVTSMSVTTSNALVLLETTAFPYTLVIDSEWLSVTACTSAAPQVVTVVRGVGGTVAAAHSSGALVDVAPYLSLPRYPSTTRYPSTSLYPTAVRERPYYAF